ncbi:MAG: hypothetical protein GY782_12015 [Gammaproteobacteria bacterium]|nr:hypothetical protein [Gammaproteobacteria bacterium]
MIEKLRRKIKNYISVEDRFIHEFDKAHPDESSPLKRQEIDKHARIARLRDSKDSGSISADETLWQDF